MSVPEHITATLDGLTFPVLVRYSIHSGEQFLMAGDRDALLRACIRVVETRDRHGMYDDFGVEPAAPDKILTVAQIRKLPRYVRDAITHATREYRDELQTAAENLKLQLLLERALGGNGAAALQLLLMRNDDNEDENFDLQDLEAVP